MEARIKREVSVLYREPKLLKALSALPPLLDGESFSALP